MLHHPKRLGIQPVHTLAAATILPHQSSLPENPPRHIQVDLFLLEPCQEFWGYISSEREEEKALKKHGKGASAAAELHLERGNRRWPCMGQLGAGFLHLVQDAGEWQAADSPLFVDPGEHTVLTCIQSDILNLRDRGKGEVEKKVVSLRTLRSRSIRVTVLCGSWRCFTITCWIGSIATRNLPRGISSS